MALSMALAVLVDGGPIITVQAGASAVLVAALLPGGGLPRAVDALIGGALGLAVAAVLPADPLAGARRGMRALLDEVADALCAVAAGLRERDEAAVLAALSRARGTQLTVEELRSAVRAGEEIAAMAPLRRRRRVDLHRLDVAAVRADYALRNVRVLARRALAALREGEALAPSCPTGSTTSRARPSCCATSWTAAPSPTPLAPPCSPRPRAAATRCSRVRASPAASSWPSCARWCSTCCRPPAPRGRTRSPHSRGSHPPEPRSFAREPEVAAKPVYPAEPRPPNRTSRRPEEAEISTTEESIEAV